MTEYTIISGYDEDGVPFVPCVCDGCGAVYQQMVYPFELPRYDFDAARQVYRHRYGLGECADCIVQASAVK